MIESPVVSVVMAVFNGEQYLHEAIDSILNQTYTDFEFIIVDDGSTDRTREIIRTYQDKRIILVENDSNKYLPTALNIGISKARAQYIARMDCDDICLPERLERQIEFMQRHPDLVAIGTAAIFMDENGNEICQFTPSQNHQQLIAIFPGSPFIHPSVMFRKDAYARAGKYPEYMNWGAEDAVLFGRMSKIGKLSNLNQPYLKYRLVPGSASRKPADFRDLLMKITLNALEDIEVNLVLLEKLKEKAKSIDKSMAKFDYHFELAKMYLWSGGGPKQARFHLNKCGSAKHMQAKVKILSLASYFPPWLTSRMYTFFTGRHFEKL